MELSKNHRLKILRVSMNLSQKEVADALEMTPGGYSLIETGKTRLTEFHLETLKNKLNFDVNYILMGDQPTGPGIASSEIETLKQENLSLKAQVKQLMDMVNNLTNSINLLSNKLGKLEGNQMTYSENKGKIVSLSTDSVTHAAKRAA